MIEFDALFCTATLKDYHNNYDGPKKINLTNILSIHEVSFNLIISTNNVNILFINLCTFFLINVVINN